MIRSVVVALAVLLLFQLIGESLVLWLGIPLPGALAGMMALLLALCLFGRIPQVFGRGSSLLLAHLMLLFIPAVAGIMTQADYMAEQWLPFVMACVGATAITLAVTAATLRYLLRQQRQNTLK